MKGGGVTRMVFLMFLDFHSERRWCYPMLMFLDVRGEGRRCYPNLSECCCGCSWLLDVKGGGVTRMLSLIFVNVRCDGRRCYPNISECCCLCLWIFDVKGGGVTRIFLKASLDLRRVS